MQHFQPIDMSARKPKISLDVYTIDSVDDSRHSRHDKPRFRYWHKQIPVPWRKELNLLIPRFTHWHIQKFRNSYVHPIFPWAAKRGLENNPSVCMTPLERRSQYEIP